MGYQEIYTNCLAYQLAQARKKVFIWYASYLKPLGLTPAYVYVLGVIHDKGAATPSQISELLDLERPTVTALLNRMEQNGFVQRTMNPNNRREVLVKMTAKGKEACEQAYPLLIEADRALDQVLAGHFTEYKQNVMEMNSMLKEAVK